MVRHDRLQHLRKDHFRSLWSPVVLVVGIWHKDHIWKELLYFYASMVVREEHCRLSRHVWPSNYSISPKWVLIAILLNDIPSLWSKLCMIMLVCFRWLAVVLLPKESATGSYDRRSINHHYLANGFVPGYSQQEDILIMTIDIRILFLVRNWDGCQVGYPLRKLHIILIFLRVRGRLYQRLS